MMMLVLSVSATASEQKLRLTLQDSVALALRQNQSIKTQNRLAAANNARVKERQTLETSDISATASGNQQTYASQDLLSAVSYTNSQAGLAYSRLLKSNRDLRHNLFADEVVAGNSESGLKLLRMQTILGTKSKYWQVIALEKRAIVETQRVNRFKVITDIADTRRRVGFGDNLEYRRAYVQLGLAEDDLASTQNDIELAKADFRRLIGMASGTEFELSDDFPLGVQEAQLLGNASESSKDEDPSVRIARRNIDKTLSDLQYARTPWWPILSMTGGYNTADGKNASVSIDSDWRFGAAANYPVRYDFPVFYQNNHYVIFNVSYPLYDGGKQSSRLQRAHDDVSTLQSYLTDLQSDLAKQLSAARIAVDRSIRHVRLLSGLQESAKENAEAARMKYQRNRLILSQLIDVEADLATAQRNYIEALYDLNVSAEQLKRQLLKDHYDDGTN